MKTTLLLFFILVNTLLAQSDITYRVDQIHLFTIDSSINPATYNYLKTEFDKRSKIPHLLFLIKMNTPGGLLSTTKDILTLFGESQKPIVVWITPEGASATSAGAIIASGSHFIFMNEGTNIGAATPIDLGSDIPESDGKKKVMNDTVSLVKSLSEARGRNSLMFEEMVTKATSLTQKDALDKKAIDGKAHSLEDIRVQLNGKEFKLLGESKKLDFSQALEVKEIEMDAGLSLLNILSHPSTCYILFLLGVALIYLEFQAPGGYVAGGLGVISLSLAAIGFQVLPLNFGSVVLLIAGVILLILEIYIVSYGLLSIAGLSALAFGSLFIYRSDVNYIAIESNLIWSTILGVGSFLIFLNYYLLKERRKNKAHDFFEHKDQKAIILHVLHPGLYQIKVNGEIWKAEGALDYKIHDEVIVTKKKSDQLIFKIKTKDV